MFIFESSSYRDALREALLEKKTKVSSRYTFQNMAKACGIQKTYLSRVLNGNGHLSVDQLYLSADYLGLSPDERKFVFLLYEYEKTSIEKWRKEISAMILAEKARQLKTESAIDAKISATTLTDFTPYYLEPILQIIHMALTIDHIRKNPKVLCELLAITEDKLSQCLSKLQSMGFVSWSAGQFKVLIDNNHLPSSSPLAVPYLKMHRLNSLQALDTIPLEKRYNSTVVFSSDPESRTKIQSLFLDFLKKVKKIVSEGKETNVYQMNFDLFPWC